MANQNRNDVSKPETRKRIFVSHAQLLSEEERRGLSEKEKEYEKNCRERGVWLELFCPDDTCFSEEERIQIPVFCEDPKIKKKLLLDIFCPDESCLVDEATKLP